MGNIWIIGSGGFSKEVCFWIKSSTDYKVQGFIEKKPINDKIVLSNDVIPIIDEDYFISNFKGENVCLGIGNPSARKEIHLKFKDFIFPNIKSVS